MPIRYGDGVDRALRVVNALVAAVTLASALAVLGSDLFVAGYRAHYGDALWFVAAYAAVQALMLVEFARGGPRMAWCALARAVAAWLFLAGFFALWPRWRFWTPARYVYELFAWDDRSAIGLFGLVFLGRGAFNTVNVVYFGRDWLIGLRARRPLLGRALTAVPVMVSAICVWAFLQLVHEEQRSFSADAQDVARIVVADLDCDAVRARSGQTTTDLRQRGDRRYHVEIAWGCPVTRVVVRAEDGRVGTAVGSRPECCGVSAPAPPA
jgi:hypothetical protein